MASTTTRKTTAPKPAAKRAGTKPRAAAAKPAAVAADALEVRRGRKHTSIVEGDTWIAWIANGTDLRGNGTPKRTRIMFGTDGSWVAAGRLADVRAALKAAGA